MALPLVTVLVVVYALLVAGAAHPIAAARIYGGPTEGKTSLALRIESVQREGENESPFWNGPLSARVRTSSGEQLSALAAHAVQGVSEVRLSSLRPVRGSLAIELRDASGALLAHGDVSLDGDRWAGRARRRGGWIRGRATPSGALVLSVAPERGAFVVGSSDPLLVRVEHAGAAVAFVALVCSAEGARLSGALQLRTDALGRARLGFEPLELNPTLRVEAVTNDGQRGMIDTIIPVVAGGFHALRTASGVRVESAVPRTTAFFSVVSDTGRIAGGVLTLAATDRGGSFGTAELPELPQPAWLVVSSEVDLNSAAAIGWPLDLGSEPAPTFDVPDVLLLDGMPDAFRRDQERRSRVRWLCAAFIALAFLLSVALLVVRVRAADRDLSQRLREELDSELAARIAPRRLLPLLVALLTIGLGFVGLGLIVVARSR